MHRNSCNTLSAQGTKGGVEHGPERRELRQTETVRPGKAKGGY